MTFIKACMSWEQQREEKRVVTKGRGQVMSKAVITVCWISKSGNTVQDCLGSRLTDSQHSKKQKTNWARETSRLMLGSVKSKSASTKRRFPHKITAWLCFQEMCVPQIDRTQKKMIKAAEAFSIGWPGRLTTCVNGLGFRRRTCLQPQQSLCGRSHWTCFAFVMSKWWMSQLTTPSIQGGWRRGLLRDRNSNKIILRPLTRGASGL